MSGAPPTLPIPDLRFEQSFMKLLEKYAGNTPQKQPSRLALLKKYNQVATLTDEDLKLMNQQLDEEEQDELSPQPLNPITPSVVIYAILKDQILMPLLQGFLWTSVLISVRPFLRIVVRNGQHAGHWVSNLLGLNQLARRSGTRSNFA